MPNKTIYVSQNDEKLFEEAKKIAGEALSSVIARALREFVARNTDKENGMKEISVKVGLHDSERIQKFIGIRIGEWNGFSDDEKWYLKAEIYRTQKNNFAILIETVGPASLLTNKIKWSHKDYFQDLRKTELVYGKTADELKSQIPSTLFEKLVDLSAKYENPVEYLDI